MSLTGVWRPSRCSLQHPEVPSCLQCPLLTTVGPLLPPGRETTGSCPPPPNPLRMKKSPGAPSPSAPAFWGCWSSSSVSVVWAANLTFRLATGLSLMMSICWDALRQPCQLRYRGSDPAVRAWQEFSDDHHHQTPGYWDQYDARIEDTVYCIKYSGTEEERKLNQRQWFSRAECHHCYRRFSSFKQHHRSTCQFVVMTGERK